MGIDTMKLTPGYYNELRDAVLTYISDDATWKERATAYRVIVWHMRAGSMPDDEHDALLADYDATLAGFEAGTGRR